MIDFCQLRHRRNIDTKNVKVDAWTTNFDLGANNNKLESDIDGANILRSIVKYRQHSTMVFHLLMTFHILKTSRIKKLTFNRFNEFSNEPTLYIFIINIIFSLFCTFLL